MATELTGRAEELQVLADLVDGEHQRGGAVVVRGDPGTGKSTLLDTVARRSREKDCEVLATSGVEAEAKLPFAGLHQLLRPILGAAEDLPIAQRRALSTAFGDDDGPAPEQFLIALAALNLLVGTATGRRVVIVVDDVQWLDLPSHEALAFIARRIGDDPVVIVAAARNGHDGPLLDANHPELALRGLGDSAARELLGRHADGLGAAEQERILAAARGNPLALVELPVAWGARRTPPPELLPLPLTAPLERAFAGTLTGLPALTRDVLLVAAIDHEGALPEILAAASLFAGEDVGVDVLEAASAAGVVRFDQMHLEFRHPLVRSGVLGSETAARQQAAHAALAAVLISEPYRRVWHRSLSIVGPDDEVADELEANVAVSLSRGAVIAAIWALERSAQLTSDSSRRGRRLLLAAEHAFGLGRADLVDRLVGAASQTLLSGFDRARMEWLQEIFNDGVPGDGARVLELCDIARQSGLAGDNDLALNLLLGAALRCWWADTGPTARARVVEVTEELPGVEGDPRYVAALAVAEPILRGRVASELLAKVVIENVTDAGDLRVLGMAAHAAGDSALAADFFARSESKLREQGRLGLLPHVLGMEANARFAMGDWQRSRVEIEEGRQLAEETGQPIWTAGTLSLEAMGHGLSGETELAFTQAAHAEQLANGRGLNNLLAVVRLARSFAWISKGRYAEACEELLPLYDIADASFHQRESFSGVMVLAEAAVHAQRADEARAVIDELEKTAEVTPAPILHTGLLYARPVLAADDDAEALFLDGLRHDMTRWPWVRARLELAYGSWLRRQRRVGESRAPLRSAQTVFDVIGATFWAEQARTELRAAGERTLVRSSAVGLSAQEWQIARMAADGLSNREIAQCLYLSPRTVGSHLYRIFPKLDITSRTQLAARLHLA